MLKATALRILPLMLLCTSCKFMGDKPAKITGTFPDGAGSSLVLQEMGTREIHSVDSVTIGHDGKFTFTMSLKEPGFWLLRNQPGNILVLLLNPGDEINLSGKFNGFPGNVILEGPREARLLNEFYRTTRQREREVDSLEMLLMESQDSAGYYALTQEVDLAFGRILEQQRTLEMDFIDKNTGSLASLVVLNYAFGMKPVLNPDDDFAYFLKLDSALMQAFPENKHVKYHHQRVIEYKHEVNGRS